MLRTSWKRTLRILPNVHTLHNQVHIVLGGAMGDVSSASNDSVFPLHHFCVDRIRLRKGFASSSRALRFLEHTMHASDTTKMTSLYHFILCILINRCLRSLSSSVMTTTMSTRMVSTHEGSTWPSFTSSFTLNAILCNCNVALWGKKICLSNPTVQTPTVNYGQFSFFRGKACIC